MAEILYELGVEGGPETSGAFEDLKIKQLQASDSSKRLRDELKALEKSGKASAAEVEHLQRQIIRADAAASSLGGEASKTRQSVQTLGEAASAMKLDVLAQSANAMFGAIAQGNPRLEEMKASIGGVASAVSAGAAAFGPWGAAVAGTVAAFVALAGAQRDATESARANLTANDELVSSIERLGETQRLLAGENSASAQQAAVDGAKSLVEAYQSQLLVATDLLHTRERDAAAARELVEETNAQNMGILQSARQANTSLEHQRSVVALIGGQLEQAALKATRYGVALAEAAGYARENARALEDVNRHIRILEREGQEGERRRQEAQAAAQQRNAARIAEQMRLDQMVEDQADSFHQTTLARIAELSRELDTTGDILGPVERAVQDTNARLTVFFDQLDRQVEESSRQRRAVIAQETAGSAASLGNYRSFIGSLQVADSDRARELQRGLQDREDAHRAHLQALQEMEGSHTLWEADQLSARTAAIREELAIRRDLSRAEEDLARTSIQSVLDDTGASLTSILGNLATGLGSAIKEIAKGTKTAGEAFQGLLASFLEMLSQMAALEAIKHYAAAIGDFASQNYAGGAAHIAAGVAWTVVAIAAGGAAVAAAPAAPAEAASPQAANDNSGGARGGTTVININGALVTAGTYAEVGRELGNMLDVSDRRYAASGGRR